MSRLSRASSSFWKGHDLLPILLRNISVTRRHTGAHPSRQLDIPFGIVCRGSAAATSKARKFVTADLYTFGEFEFRRKPSRIQRYTQGIRSQLRACDRQRETARESRTLLPCIGKNYTGLLRC